MFFEGTSTFVLVFFYVFDWIGIYIFFFLVFRSASVLLLFKLLSTRGGLIGKFVMALLI